MPDEQSNLNLPPAARRPNNRRRGRRGGRGRGGPPRPTGEPTAPLIGGEPPGSQETITDDVATGSEAAGSISPETPLPVATTENTPTPIAGEPIRASRPQPAVPLPRPERRPEPQRPKPWVKPADFRPADTSAIHQAVVHATEIAESIRELTERIEEILELVEIAERQKLADERELENLRRALRRIQPPRQLQAHEPHRGHSQARLEQRPRQESSHTGAEPSHSQESTPEHHSEGSSEPQDSEEGNEPENTGDESQSDE